MPVETQASSERVLLNTSRKAVSENPGPVHRSWLRTSPETLLVLNKGRYHIVGEASTIDHHLKGAIFKSSQSSGKLTTLTIKYFSSAVVGRRDQEITSDSDPKLNNVASTSIIQNEV